MRPLGLSTFHNRPQGGGNSEIVSRKLLAD
jgi:hypothetical protein